jgi:hypothetical protein
MPYIGTSPSQGVRRVHTYTATANQTSFSGAGAEGATLSYKDSNFVDVYQNGVKLGDADYTATSGTAIVLGTGATVSDLVVIVAYDVFSAADTVSKADGGQFDGNVTMAGTITVTGNADLNGDLDVDGTTNLDVVDIDGAVDMASTLNVTGAITSSAGATITTADNSKQLILKSTDADANVGPVLELKRDSSSPADNDYLGYVRFVGENDASEETVFAQAFVIANDVSDGTEDATFEIDSMSGGNQTQRLNLNPTETVFNDGSVDLDFRVESNGNANMLFVDGGNDKIGIGLNSPGTSLHIRSSVASNIAGYRDGTTGLIVEGDAASYIQLVASKTNPMAILFDGGDTHNDTARGGLIYDIDTGLSIKSGGSTRWTINETGNLLPSATSLGVYLGVTSATASNLLDDYEEGTWTPTDDSDSGGSITAFGRYTKVGRLVTIHFTIRIDNTFSEHNRIGGLPFAPSQDTTISSVHGMFVMRSNNRALYGHLISGATYFQLMSSLTGTSATPSTSDSILRGIATYQTS